MAIDINDYPNKITVGLYANAKHDKFYYVFTYNKRKYRGLIDFSDKNWNKRDRVNEATLKLMEFKKAKEQKVGDGRVKLDDFFYAHYELKKDTAWTKTLISHYRRYVSPILGNMRLQDIFNHDIKRVLAYQGNLGLGARTVKQTLEALAPVFKDAIANRLIVFNPMDGVSVTRPNTKKIVSNADEEINIFYNGVLEEFGTEPFYKAFYLFALHGRRKSEIMKLEVADISFSKSYYILRDVKNKEHQKMYLDEEIATELKKFMNNNKKWVFMSSKRDNHIVNIEKTTQRLRERIGKHFTLHYMRNVVVSAMAEHDVGDVMMGASLGHNNVNTLRAYLTMPYAKGSRKASDVINFITKRA